MKNITVYCASSNNISESFLNSAFELGKNLALSGFDICYGGGKVGLMGQLADGAISCGGHVTGVIPEFMIELELEHTGVNKLLKVGTMHERQMLMLKDSDAIIALPGGSGTYAELFEAITWKRLGLINCPIIIVNLENYFDSLELLLQKAIDEGFMRKNDFELWNITSSIDETIRFLHKNINLFIHYDLA
jgi:uncharacterized protein (TIGR00730 family)